MEEINREQEQRYASVIEALKSGVVLQHADGSIRACNSSAERILGLTANQMMGRTSIDPRWRAVHEDGSPFPGETHPAMISLRTGQPVSDVVMGVHHADDTLAWILINAQPLFHSHASRPYAVVATFEDITERKRLEDALRAQEALFRSLFAHSIDAILIATVDGQLLAANREANHLFGFTEAELRAGGRELIINPSDLRWPAAIEQRDRTGVFRGELSFRRKDTTTFLGEVSSVHYHDQHGYPQISIIVRDVSERHRLEVELRRAEQIQRAILNTIPDPTWLIDSNGRYVSVNSAFEQLYQMVPTSLGGATPAGLDPDGSDPYLVSEAAHSLALNEKQRAEIQVADQHGQQRWFDVITSPLEAIDEQMSGSVGIAHDITNRKLFQQERESLLLQLTEALRRTETLYRVTDTLNRTHEKSDILHVIVESAASVLPAHRTVLIRVDMENQVVRRQIEGGPGALHVPPLTFSELLDGLSGVVLREGQAVRSIKGVADDRESEQVQHRRVVDQAGSILVAPIQSQGNMLGTLTAINAPDGPDFTSDDMELLAALANDAAIAIERSMLLDELKHQANIDGLTQLANRRSWFEQSHQSVAITAQSGNSISVILLDADHFKHVNDTYGHAVGDLVLQSISQILTHNVRSGDIVGRYGGEEFAIYLPDTNALTAYIIAERIRQAMEHHPISLPHREQHLTMSVSIGVATAQAQSVSLATLLADADRALYGAKSAGRNCVRPAPE